MSLFDSNFEWWLAVIDLPVLAALFIRLEKLTEEVARTKIDMARSYASHSEVHELEERLTAHLLRIERKLDTTSLQTAALQARKGD